MWAGICVRCLARYIVVSARLLYTACGSFHKCLWPLWCYSQGLQSVKRLDHNTCVRRPAVKGLVGWWEWTPPAVALRYSFTAILLPYSSDVLKVEKENGSWCWAQRNQTSRCVFVFLSIRTATAGQSLFQNICHECRNFHCSFPGSFFSLRLDGAKSCNDRSIFFCSFLNFCSRKQRGVLLS